MDFPFLKFHSNIPDQVRDAGQDDQHPQQHPYQPFNSILPQRRGTSGFSERDDDNLLVLDSLDPSYLSSPTDYTEFNFSPVLNHNNASSTGTGLGPGSPLSQSAPQMSFMPPTPATATGGESSSGGVEMEAVPGMMLAREGSVDEKDLRLTPAQSRRKAQNRAAQRAFRERKERHVKELEAKLSALETSANSLQSDNERLRLALQRIKTENDILRSSAGITSMSSSSKTTATNSSSSSTSGSLSSIANSSRNNSDMSDSTTGTSILSGTRTLSPQVEESSDANDSTSQNGDTKRRPKLLSAGATWNLIMAHPLVDQGLVDVADVWQRLRGYVRCEEMGPVYDEEAVQRVIEESREEVGDEFV